MGMYRYAGVDETGDEIRGTLEAESLYLAAEDLRGQGIRAYLLEPVEKPGVAPPTEDMDAFSYFNRSLADLTRIGVPLPRALKELGREVRDKRIRKEVDRVVAAVSEGDSLGDAIGKGRGAFPDHYAALVRAGMASGSLPGMFLLMARARESVRQVRRSLEEALAYPVATVLFGVFLAVAALVLYIPGVARFYEATRYEVPWMMRILFSVVDSPILVACFILVASGLLAWSVTRIWRSTWGESMLLRIPLLGDAFRSVMQSRFLGTLAELLAAGAPPDDSLSLAVAASGSRILADRHDSMCDRVRDGTAIPDVLRGSVVISPEIGDALAALGPGAARGLSEMLLLRASAQSDALSSFLRPAAIIAAGILVGSGIVISFWTAVAAIF